MLGRLTECEYVGRVRGQIAGYLEKYPPACQDAESVIDRETLAPPPLPHVHFVRIERTRCPDVATLVIGARWMGEEKSRRLERFKTPIVFMPGETVPTDRAPPAIPAAPVLSDPEQSAVGFPCSRG